MCRRVYIVNNWRVFRSTVKHKKQSNTRRCLHPNQRNRNVYANVVTVLQYNQKRHPISRYTNHFPAVRSRPCYNRLDKPFERGALPSGGEEPTKIWAIRSLISEMYNVLNFVAHQHHHFFISLKSIMTWKLISNAEISTKTNIYFNENNVVQSKTLQFHFNQRAIPIIFIRFSLVLSFFSRAHFQRMPNKGSACFHVSLFFNYLILIVSSSFLSFGFFHKKWLRSWNL